MRVDLPLVTTNDFNAWIEAEDKIEMFASYISDVSSGGIISLAFEESFSVANSDLFKNFSGQRKLSSAAEDQPEQVQDRQ